MVTHFHGHALSWSRTFMATHFHDHVLLWPRTSIVTHFYRDAIVPGWFCKSADFAKSRGFIADDSGVASQKVGDPAIFINFCINSFLRNPVLRGGRSEGSGNTLGWFASDLSELCLRGYEFHTGRESWVQREQNEIDERSRCLTVIHRISHRFYR